MKSRYSIVACIAIVFAVFLIAAPRQSIVSAEPNAQSTRAPTEEPTKRPYAFPTPIFIPTYADDTPVARNTPAASSVTIQPGADTYTVQSGDSLWVISQKVYGDGSKYKLIMQANDMTDQTKLRVGSVLKIPSVPGAVPSLAPTAAPQVLPPQIVPTTSSVMPAPTSMSQGTVALLTVPAPTPIPTPAPSTAFSGETIGTLINLVSLILFVTGIGSGLLAYLRYQRTRRLEALSSTKHPIRVRQ
ncbi:MAG: LysM peptidoglycan-binding domain-containing protein [Chloroflexi bacterium]|nr:LysM peptidoglycan-binding domain-containing protein [Chloroflexota bacterium]